MKEPRPVLTLPEASQAGDRHNKVIRSVYPTKAASLEANRLRSLAAVRPSAPVGVQDARCKPSRATGALTPQASDVFKRSLAGVMQAAIDAAAG